MSSALPPSGRKPVRGDFVRVHLRELGADGRSQRTPPEARLLLRGARDALVALTRCRSEQAFSSEAVFVTVEWTIAADGSVRDATISNALKEPATDCEKTVIGSQRFAALAARPDVRLTAWFGFDAATRPNAAPLDPAEEVLVLDKSGVCVAVVNEECPPNKSCGPPPRREIDCPTEHGAPVMPSRETALRVLSLGVSTPGDRGRTKVVSLYSDATACAAELRGSYAIEDGRRQTSETEDVPCATFEWLWSRASKSYPKDAAASGVGADASRFSVSIERRSNPTSAWSARRAEGPLEGESAFHSLLACDDRDKPPTWLGCTLTP